MKADEESLRQASIAEIEDFLARRGGAGRTVLALLEQDARAGVRQVAVRERRRLRQREKEQRRLRRIRHHEEGLWQAGRRHLAGVDEVGRGCLAGPVVAAAVILPPNTRLPGIDDSKVLDAEQRHELRQQIESVAIAWHVGIVSAARIDKINILEASMEAMRVALDGLTPRPEHVLVDGNRSPGSELPESLLINGDARSMSIAAASIVAKQYRDDLMVRLDEEYPGYGFASNKGYASPLHRQALARIGPCAEHRYSFAPLSRRDQMEFELGAGSEAPAVADTGTTGEDIAAQYLEAKGYTIEDRRYRAAGGEIDIVARQGSCWVFVEVKSTAGNSPESRPEQRLHVTQRRRMIRAATHFLRFRTTDGDSRFDVLSIDLSRPSGDVEHWVDAFTIDTRFP